jgi:hypothetical protein
MSIYCRLILTDSVMLKSVHIVLLLAIVATLVAHWLMYSLEDSMAPYCGAGLTISSIIRFTGSSIRMAHQAFMSRVRLSFAKAMYVDFPILLTMMPFQNSIPFVAVATLFQEIRLSGKAVLMQMGFDQTVAAVGAGVAGGVVKYSILGLNPVVGAVATAAYEVCGNYKSCADNPFVNIPVIFSIETFDQTVHGVLRTGGLNWAAVSFGIKLGMYCVITCYGMLVPAMATTASA